MKLYAPRYYKKFKCIADKCEHSCCIGWEIDIDEKTLEKYDSLNGGYGKCIKASISKEDTAHFKLLGERCPHLDESGLCKIITNLGEGYLCDICREHPRFYNFTSIAEVGIGMSCREAAEIILSSTDYACFECVGETDGEACDTGFDSLSEREKIYEILSDASKSYEARLKAIYNSYAIDEKSDGYWLEALDLLEYLDESHKDLFMTYSSKHRASGFDEALERFLAYFIYRHTADAIDREDFCARLGFALFCERLFSSIIYLNKPKTARELATLASIISEEIEYSIDNTFALTY